MIRPATREDVDLLAPLMRPADVAEVEACGLSPIEALARSLEVSQEAWALDLGGEVAALFGVEPGPRESLIGEPDFHVVWALTGRAVDGHKKEFLLASRDAIAAFLARYPVLVNFIDARYEASLRWAVRIGGELRPAVAFGQAGEPFHPVIFRRDAWAQPQG